MFDFFGNPFKLSDPQPLWKIKPAGWQKCPVCEGTGNIEVEGAGVETCDVCKGHKIINRATGKPSEE